MGHRLRVSTLVVTTVASVASLAMALLVVAAPAGAASRADDVKTARQGVLVAGDFPSGWHGSRNTDASDAQAIKIASRIPSCKDYVKLRKLMLGLPEARSLDYDDGAGTTMSNRVKAFASTARANAAMKLFASGKNPDCLGKLTEAGIGSGATVSVEATNLSGLPAGSVAYTADVADKSGAVVSQFRTVIVPDQRFVSMINIEVTTSDPPIDVIDAAANTSLTRLDAAVNR